MASGFSISDQWPDEGKIQFTDFRLRYGVDLPYVLDGLTFNIRALEKIGVVGRTGAGLLKCFIYSLEIKSKLLESALL